VIAVEDVIKMAKAKVSKSDGVSRNPPNLAAYKCMALRISTNYQGSIQGRFVQP
jgi:hypothetical protein